MRVLDLFAGLEGWSGPFRERDHDVISVDIEPSFDVDLHADVLELEPADLPWKPDIVLASPPCEGFSVLTMGKSWTVPYPGTRYPHLRAETEPKSATAELGLRLVERTLWLLEELEPSYYVIENPRAKLRKLGVIGGLDRRSVSYCQYGEPFQKSTDLWGGFPPSLELRPLCTARVEYGIRDQDGIPYVLDRDGRPCHVSAPRGSATGIQGDGIYHARISSRQTRGGLAAQKAVTRDVYGTSDKQRLAALRAKVPAELSLEVCLAAEHDLAIGAAAYSGRLFE